MANLVETLTSVRSRIRRRCDQENSTFVSDTEINEEINGSYADLVDSIYDNADTEALLSSHDVSTVAGTDVYTISGTFSHPDDGPVGDVYRVAGVDAQFSGKWRAIRKWTFANRNHLVDITGWSSSKDTFYRIHGHVRTAGELQMRFFPTPQAVHSVRVWYMPLAPNAANTMGVLALNGWDEFIVADVCAKILEKEESDSRPFLARRNRALDRIVWAASNLDDSGYEGIREVIDWGNPSGRHSEENSEYS